MCRKPRLPSSETLNLRDMLDGIQNYLVENYKLVQFVFLQVEDNFSYLRNYSLFDLRWTADFCCLLLMSTTSSNYYIERFQPFFCSESSYAMSTLYVPVHTCRHNTKSYHGVATLAGNQKKVLTVRNK